MNGHLAPREVAHAPDALRVAARHHQALLAARPLDERHAAAPELFDGEVAIEVREVRRRHVDQRRARRAGDEPLHAVEAALL
jgi:hypothetical protein